MMLALFIKLYSFYLISIGFSTEMLHAIGRKPRSAQTKTIHQDPNALQPVPPMTPTIQQFIHSTRSKEHHFMQAIKDNDIELVQFWLDYGIDINFEINGLTPLKVAIAHSHEEILILLLSLQNPRILVYEQDIAQAEGQVEIISVAFKESSERHDLCYPQIERTYSSQEQHHKTQFHQAFRIYALLHNHYLKNPRSMLN